MDKLLVNDNRQVVADGWLAGWCQEFLFEWVADSGMIGGDAFTEVYFTTNSGNIYRIGTACGRGNRGGWQYSVMNANLQRGKATLAEESILSHEEALSLVLRVGSPLMWSGGNTTAITSILAVNAARCYPNISTHLPQASLRRKFWERIYEGQACPDFNCPVS